MYVCMKIQREEEFTSRWWSGGGLIGLQNVAQSKDCGVRWNPPMTSIIQPIMMMWAWMILIKNFIPFNFQISKIISESFLLTPLFQNGVWKDGIFDLDSGSIEANSNSGKWLKSSESSGVEIYSGSGSKSRSWSSNPYSFSPNRMWHYKIGDLSSKRQVWE